MGSLLSVLQNSNKECEKKQRATGRWVNGNVNYPCYGYERKDQKLNSVEQRNAIERR